MRSNNGLELFAYIAIAFGSGVWLFIQDIAYLVPIMGIVGPILVIKRLQSKVTVEEIREEIIDKLPKVFDLKPSDLSKVDAFASSVTSNQKQKYAE